MPVIWLDHHTVGCDIVTAGGRPVRAGKLGKGMSVVSP